MDKRYLLGGFRRAKPPEAGKILPNEGKPYLGPHFPVGAMAGLPPTPWIRH